MNFRIAFLGLIFLGAAFSAGWSAPTLSELQDYTTAPSIDLVWEWDDANITDQFYDNFACDSYPCFIYYEICENESNIGRCANFFYSNFSDHKEYQVYGNPEGGYMYRVRARVIENSSDMGEVAAFGIYTEWSNTEDTIADYNPPAVFAYSDKPVYSFGERAYLTVHATDSSSGVNQTALSFHNYTLINSSWGGSVVFSEVFNPGVYFFGGGAIDMAGHYSISTVSSFQVLAIGTPTCSDGTPYDACSATKPKYCLNGTLIKRCTTCGCPTGYSCNTTSNACYVSVHNALCGNGLCEAGESLACCRDCACASGQMCNITNDKCYVPPGPVTYIALSLVSPNVTDISLSPGQTVRFILELKDENKGLVNNATVTVYPTAEKYTSGFIGDGQYEVIYQARTNTTSYFQEYTINLRAKRYLNAQEQFSQTLSLSIVLNRFLDIYFVTPQQNQTVTESQPVEVKIEYPDGSPVLVGSFDMLFGEKTIPLALSGDTYRAFLNLTNESYGAKNATFIGRDNYNNTLNNILVVYYTQKIDYTAYFMALLLMVGGSAAAYFLYTWGSGLSKDYKMLKKEKVYLETMDKRTHLEFFKRHIDESTFKKLVLEYQQKTTDVDKIVVEMEKRHRWLRWL